MAGPGIFQEDTHRDSRRLAAMHEQIILDGHQAYTICSANGRAARGVFHHGVYPDCDRLAKRNAHATSMYVLTWLALSNTDVISGNIVRRQSNYWNNGIRNHKNGCQDNETMSKEKQEADLLVVRSMTRICDSRRVAPSSLGEAAKLSAERPFLLAAFTLVLFSNRPLGLTCTCARAPRGAHPLGAPWDSKGPLRGGLLGPRGLGAPRGP